MEAVQLDVCKPEDVKRARDEVGAKTGGKLDVLVNNAYVFFCFCFAKLILMHGA